MKHKHKAIRPFLYYYNTDIYPGSSNHQNFHILNCIYIIFFKDVFSLKTQTIVAFLIFSIINNYSRC